MSEVAIQAHLLNTVLTRAWLREAPAGWASIGVALLAGLTAWLWLTARWWKAAVGVTVLALGYAASLSLSPSLTGVLLPLVAPLVAMVVSSAGALAWNQLTSAYRLRRLEGEVAEIREALVRQESSVEGLEEDLEAARAAAARSTGGEEALRAELAAARAQEEPDARPARRAGAPGAEAGVGERREARPAAPSTRGSAARKRAARASSRAIPRCWPSSATSRRRRARPCRFSSPESPGPARSSSPAPRTA